MNKQGKKGNGLRRLFTGRKDSARMSPERAGWEDLDYSESDSDDILEDLLMKYGKYLDEDGVPLQGINPKPKYYVLPKEPQKPQEETPTVPKKVTVRKTLKKEPKPKKVLVRKVSRPVKVRVKKRKPPVKVTVKKRKV